MGYNIISLLKIQDDSPEEKANFLNVSFKHPPSIIFNIQILKYMLVSENKWSIWNISLLLI